MRPSMLQTSCVLPEFYTDEGSDGADPMETAPMKKNREREKHK